MEKPGKKLATVHLDETVLEAAANPAIEMEEQLRKSSMAQREEQVKVEIFAAKPEPSLEVPEKQIEAGPEKEVYIEEDQKLKEAREAVVASDALEAMAEAEKASESDLVEEVAEAEKPGMAEPGETGNANSVNEVEVKREAGREQVGPKGQSEERTGESYSEVAKVEKEVQIEDRCEKQSAVTEALEEVTEELVPRVKKVRNELDEDKLEKDFVCNESVQQTEDDRETVTALAEKATEGSLEAESSSTDTGLPSENKIEKAKQETGNIANSEEARDPENKEEKTRSELIEERGVEEVVKPEEKSTTDVEERTDPHGQPKGETVAQPVTKQSKNLISKVKRSLLKAKKAVIGK